MGDISFKAVHVSLIDWVLETLQIFRVSGRLTGFPFGPSSPGGPLAPAGPAAPGGPASPFSPLSPLGPYSSRGGHSLHQYCRGQHFLKKSTLNWMWFKNWHGQGRLREMGSKTDHSNGGKHLWKVNTAYMWFPAKWAIEYYVTVSRHSWYIWTTQTNVKSTTYNIYSFHEDHVS